jgi:hypothetical protein
MENIANVQEVLKTKGRLAAAFIENLGMELPHYIFPFCFRQKRNGEFSKIKLIKIDQHAEKEPGKRVTNELLNGVF